MCIREPLVRLLIGFVVAVLIVVLLNVLAIRT